MTTLTVILVTFSFCLFLSSQAVRIPLRNTNSTTEISSAPIEESGESMSGSGENDLEEGGQFVNEELELLERRRAQTFDKVEQGIILEEEWELFNIFMKELQNETKVGRVRRSMHGSVIIPGWKEGQLYPFSTVVKVSSDSSGCSATLVGPRHVLTAAHCIHVNGQFKSKVSSIKIGLQQRNRRFHWIRASEAHVPKQWIVNSKLRPLSIVKYDYALLKLARPHARRTMKLGTHSFNTGSSIGFAGYKGKVMWYHYCSVKLKSNKFGLALTSCDVEKGISGSSVYLTDSQGIATVVGLVSGIVMRTKTQRYSAINYLTESQVQQICLWMTGKRRC